MMVCTSSVYCIDAGEKHICVCIESCQLKGILHPLEVQEKPLRTKLHLDTGRIYIWYNCFGGCKNINILTLLP